VIRGTSWREDAPKEIAVVPMWSPERPTDRLTQRLVDTLSLAEGQIDRTYWDTDVSGFGVRLRAGGSKTFVFWYRIGKHRRKMQIGAATAITVGDARKRAAILHAEVKLGRDPAGEKATNKVRADETFGAILPTYLARQRERLRTSAYREVERHLHVHVRRLHPQSLVDITRRDIATTLSTLGATKSGATVNRIRTSLSTFFTWCMREGLLEANPAVFTDRRPETSRDRLLTAGELRSIWGALKDDAYGAIVKLLLLTGCRATEIGALRRSEVDLPKALVTLPPARVKNKRERIVVLSEPALAVLQNRQRLVWPDGTPCDLVFGRGTRGFNDWRGSKVDLDARIAKLGGPLEPWVLHDFRRAVSTVMHEQLGIQPHVVEACLGHVGHRRGVSGVYNRAVYEHEMRIALGRWADYVLAVVEGHELRSCRCGRPDPPCTRPPTSSFPTE
jgi:integrase